LAHGNTIAASPDLLLTIRQCLAITKIDEVVLRCERGRLTGNWRILTILLATCAEDRGIESQRVLNVTTSTIVVIVIVIVIVVIVIALVALVVVVVLFGGNRANGWEESEEKSGGGCELHRGSCVWCRSTAEAMK